MLHLRLMTSYIAFFFHSVHDIWSMYDEVVTRKKLNTCQKLKDMTMMDERRRKKKLESPENIDKHLFLWHYHY